MNPHELAVLRRFADAMTSCYTPEKNCKCCPVGSSEECYFDNEDNIREALDILNRLLVMPYMTADEFPHLEQRARYAIASRSRDLVRETYGAAKMAYTLGAINRDQFRSLNRILVVEGLNNPLSCLE